jgi:hypothetical protein
VTVHRLHPWTLDEATLANAAVVAAGGGLPRRIVPHLGAAGIVADAPTRFYRLNGSLADEMGGPAIVAVGTYYVGPTPQDGQKGVFCPSSAGWLQSSFAPLCQSPWSVEWRVRLPTNYLANGAIWSTCAGSKTTAPGAALYMDNVGNGLLHFYLVTGTSGSDYLDLTFALGSTSMRDWHDYALTYDGSRTAAGVHLYMDGAEAGKTVLHDTATGATNSAYQAYWAMAPGGSWPQDCELDDLAWWPSVLTQAQIQRHVGIATSCTAEWSRTFTGSGTVKGVTIAGNRSARVGPGAAEAFTLEAFLDGISQGALADGGLAHSIAVTAGQVFASRVTFPAESYVASPDGEGPVLVYEEADPPSVYVHEPLSVTVQDRTTLSVTVEDRTALTVVVED